MTAGCTPGARIATFLLTCILAASALHVVRAQGAAGNNSLPAVPPEVVLRPDVVPYDLEASHQKLDKTNQPFLREPALGPESVFRRVLRFGKDTNNAVALIWDRPNGKLYFDLNRNLDLTDDPTGVFTATNKGHFTQYFTNVALPLKTAGGFYPAILNLRLSSDREGNYVQAQLGSRILWQAKVASGGAEWQVAVLDEVFDPQGPAAGKFLLLRPWAERTNYVSLRSGGSGLVPFPDQLFWVGQAFHLERRFDTGGEAPVCKLEFTPRQPPLTDLKLSGESVYYAVLGATNGYTVVMREPPGTVNIPKGIYAVNTVWLKKGEAKAWLQPEPPLVINATVATNSSLGGPLTNLVILNRSGRKLQMYYQLRGADGRAYRLAQVDRTKPPEFTVYRGGKKVLSGKFEFG